MNTKHLLLLLQTAAAHPHLQTPTMNKKLSLFIICVLLQDGGGFPTSEPTEAPVQAAHLSHIRTKRCSCNSWDDKECIYFCHLDIIWVNTPSNLLPYGLGGSLSRRRRRRSANRCKCLSGTDKPCRSFCHKSSEDSRTNDSTPPVKSINSNKLLSHLRFVAQSNTLIASKSSFSGVHRLRNRT